MSNLSERKARIREAMLAQRRTLPVETQGSVSQKILEHLKEKFPWEKINRVALYRAIGGEVTTVGVEQWLRSRNKLLFFPRTQTQAKTIDMVAMGPKDAWVKGPWGALEPPPGKAGAAPADLDLVILPGVAFDRSGRRLGRGQGCYDRWLKDFTGIRVGLAHTFQVLEEIPEEPLDEGVDFVVTPEEFWQVPRKL